GNDWGAILVTGGGSASLTYATVRYGGYAQRCCYPTYTANLWVEGSSTLSLSHTTVANSGYHGIVALGGSTLTVQDSTIRDNGLNGVHVDGAAATVTSNTVSGNGSNGVYAANASAL